MNQITYSTEEIAEYLKKVNFDSNTEKLDISSKETIKHHAEKGSILEKAISLNNDMLELTELIVKAEYASSRACEEAGVDKKDYESENKDLLKRLEIIENILLNSDVMRTFSGAQRKVNGRTMKRRP